MLKKFLNARCKKTTKKYTLHSYSENKCLAMKKKGNDGYFAPLF